jgi:hypothetical protein
MQFYLKIDVHSEHFAAFGWKKFRKCLTLMG